MRMGLRGSRFGEGGGGQDQLLADADLGRFGQAVGGGEGLPADAVLVGDAGKRVTGFDDDGALRGARLAGGAGRCGGMGGGSGLDDRSGLGGRDGLDNRRIDGGRTDRAVDDFRGCGSLAGRCDGDQLGLAAAAVLEQRCDGRRGAVVRRGDEQRRVRREDGLRAVLQRDVARGDRDRGAARLGVHAGGDGGGRRGGEAFHGVWRREGRRHEIAVPEKVTRVGLRLLPFVGSAAGCECDGDATGDGEVNPLVFHVSGFSFFLLGGSRLFKNRLHYNNYNTKVVKFQEPMEKSSTFLAFRRTSGFSGLLFRRRE